MSDNVVDGIGPLRNYFFKQRSKKKKMYKFVPYNLVRVKPAGTKCPKPRSGHRIVADSGNIYCFGGYNTQPDVPHEDQGDLIILDTCMLFKELWKFNLASQRWMKLKTNGEMPEELASHAAVLIGDNMLVFGGTGVPFGASSSNSVHMCNLKTLTWSKVETFGSPPLEQYGQGVAVHDGKLYVVGGTTGYEYSMNVHCLDLKTKEWSEVCRKACPEPRYRHEIVIDNDKLHVFGGGTIEQSFSLIKVPVLNLKEQAWEKVVTSKGHPTARLCHGCVRINDDVIICGGHDTRDIFSDIWSINIKTLCWRKLPCELTEPVYFHSAAVSPEGQMFVFGGVTQDSRRDHVRTNSLYSVWLKIPSLTEICWQAVLHYSSQISKLKEHELLSIGIPKRYVNRLDHNM